jgi:murein DD-endopeptidase MepM/ murein hydrolase activator NlpD
MSILKSGRDALSFFVFAAFLFCPLKASGFPVYYPMEGNLCVTSDFGYRNGEFHYGLDLWTENIGKSHLLSIADGVVIRTGFEITAGYFVMIRHDKLSVVSRYFHMDRIFVRQGQKVKKRSRIGTPGNTGKSNGTHLHIEIIKNREKINPRLFFKIYGIYFCNCHQKY